MSRAEKIFDMPVADVYLHYVNKISRKGQNAADLDVVIGWLTGFDKKAIQRHLGAKTTFRDFFAQSTLHPNAGLITGSICGVKIEEIQDPLMRKIRYLDKLVDEVAKGRPMAKILRSTT
jgi:hypothetical protein